MSLPRLPVCALWLAASGMLAAACTPDFQSPSQVTDLRILAIRSEPAEALFNLESGKVDPVRVKALIADPHPHGKLAVQGRVCFPTDSGRCEGVPTLDLLPPLVASAANEQQALYDSLAIPAELVAGALQDDRLKGFGGVRVQFALDADDGDPHGRVHASKLLLYRKAGAGGQPNHNPDIVGLRITIDGATVATVRPGGPLQLAVGVEYGLRPLLGEGGSGIEEYDTVDLSGKTIHLREAPRYSFFATAPLDLDRDDADEPIPEQPQPANGIARFTAGSSGTATLWVVARDGRGGIGWISVAASASPAAAPARPTTPESPSRLRAN